MNIQLLSSSLKRSLRIVLLLMISCLLNYGCSYMSHKPEGITVLTSVPMGNTAVSSYLSVSTFYESDTTLYLIARWDGKVESGGHATRWEILDSNGKKVFSSSRKKLTIHSHMFTITPVAVKEILPDSQSHGQLTVQFYMDDVLSLSKKIQYKNQSITGRGTQQVIILPFIEQNTEPTPWAEGIRHTFQNTVADAIFCEVNRYFADTIPHYVAEQKVGKKLDLNCLKDKACASFLKETFGDNIFIYGNLSIQKFDMDASYLTVFVYNMKTDKLERFHFFQRYNFSYPSLLRDLLSGVFHEKKMSEYIKNM